MHTRKLHKWNPTNSECVSVCAVARAETMVVICKSLWHKQQHPVLDKLPLLSTISNTNSCPRWDLIPKEFCTEWESLGTTSFNVWPESEVEGGISWGIFRLASSGFSPL
uniref:Uncharacterized protein n=1 Tax=Physcomitrium patens TaxID=3218 RepID=A0A2K1K063_PHYPA|nr:hypothetical protein PHYPA_014285 [Physcomitrium patens]